MSDEKSAEQEKPAAPETPNTPAESQDDGEFKITVRKLDMPVRPRGVLAE
jgi:hypothetical protein